MAQSVTRQNTIRKDSTKAAASPPEPKQNASAWRFNRKSQLALGGLSALLSGFLLLAFVSYLLHGFADQSVLDALTSTPLPETGTEVRNWMGAAGALVAHTFIFRWFGVAALGVPVILFLGGWRLLVGRDLLPLGRTTKEILFFMVWISLLAGYFVHLTGQVETGSRWCGGVGYELNLVLHALLGHGSIALIGFLLFLFLIFFYDLTSVPAIKLPVRPAKTVAGVPEDEQPEPDDFVDVPRRQPVAAPEPAAPEPVVPELAAPEPVVPEPTEALPPPTVAQPLTLTPAATPSAGSAPRLTLTIEDTTAKPAEPVAEAYAGPTDEVAGDASEDLLQKHGLYDPTLDLPVYSFPTVELLRDYPENQQTKVTSDELEANKDRIVETLQNYGITIERIMATIGPTVTLYEIVPAAGVRISKIKSLEDDIALSLAALGIRIIAPMPGKGTIGIEVPNKSREMVSMRSMITSERFSRSNFELPVVMGKTISNEILVADLAKMPHLLMAGATGQGKSVGLNVLLTSLIYKKHPSQLKLVLVDPKKVELTLFNKLERHFLAMLPGSNEAIITDTKKVVNTLNSLCIEMDNRYNLLKDAGCRNLKEYNAKFVQRRLSPEKGHRYLPYIVLIIDELADLMMTAGKEVEQPIARLAQLARAIGIHLVVATQRPSVNVITGLIKANFPARLSFKVTSKIDSRTILDTGGAEQLVGMGDMLFASNSDIVRLQCPFVDTPEIEEICDFVGNQRGYDGAYALPEFEGDEGGQAEEKDVDLSNRDPMFEEAARLVVIHQQGSTSLIQRRLKLGYNRAGRLIDQLEAAGIVGPFEGSKAREVLIQDPQVLEDRLKQL